RWSAWPPPTPRPTCRRRRSERAGSGFFPVARLAFRVQRGAGLRGGLDGGADFPGRLALVQFERVVQGTDHQLAVFKRVGDVGILAVAVRVVVDLSATDETDVGEVRVGADVRIAGGHPQVFAIRELEDVERFAVRQGEPRA